MTAPGPAPGAALREAVRSARSAAECAASVEELLRRADVGHLTDLGAIFDETHKKIFPWYFHGISMSYDPGK